VPPHPRRGGQRLRARARMRGRCRAARALKRLTQSLPLGPGLLGPVISTILAVEWRWLVPSLPEPAMGRWGYPTATRRAGCRASARALRPKVAPARSCRCGRGGRFSPGVCVRVLPGTRGTQRGCWARARLSRRAHPAGLQLTGALGMAGCGGMLRWPWSASVAPCVSRCCSLSRRWRPTGSISCGRTKPRELRGVRFACGPRARRSSEPGWPEAPETFHVRNSCPAALAPTPRRSRLPRGARAPIPLGFAHMASTRTQHPNAVSGWGGYVRPRPPWCRPPMARLR